MPRKGPAPDKWITGPDPVLHAQYRAWLQQRNQAQWRREGWAADFDAAAWRAVWGDQWVLRGRLQHQLLMTRRNTHLPWSEHNVHIVTRAEHVRNQVAQRQSGQRSAARQRWLDKQQEIPPADPVL